jgi:tripartite-type tricarboxylate transporter receptor subunit TctC
MGEQSSSFQGGVMKPLACVGKFAIVVALLCGVAGAAHADEYPSKPVRLVVGFAPGGINDIVARLTAENLSPILRQPVIVENRPGAGATVAADLVSKSRPDGYTLLLGSVSNIAMAPSQYKNLPYDPAKDFAHISPVASGATVLVVNPKFEAQSVQQIIALAKQKPGQLVYGSGGLGSSTHFNVELFTSMAGINMLHTAYKGDAPSVTDVVAGHIPMAFPSLAAAMPFIKSGQVKPLAVSTVKRSSFLPELPTVAESGVPGFDVNIWLGVFAAPATPREIVMQLNAAVAKITQQQNVRDRLASMGAEPMSSSPEQFSALIRTEIAKWNDVARAAKMPQN